MTATIELRDAETLKREPRWWCSDCDDHHWGFLPEPRSVYMANDVAAMIEGNEPYDSDDVIEVSELGLTPRSIIDCPVSGWSWASDCYQSGAVWVCPGCEGAHETSHEAAQCCEYHDLDDPISDNCLRFVGVDQSDINDGWAYCVCDKDDANDCEWKVCLTCHATMRRLEEMQAHVEQHKEEDSEAYDEPVDKVEVGGPEHLPPAYKYVEEADAPVSGCTICSGPYCCELHGIHKTPHRGHAG